MKKSTITSEQIRAARMLLRWGQQDLAEKSGMSLPTIKRIEMLPGEFGAHETTIKAIRRAFENEGIRFLGGSSPGVRLRESHDDDDTRRRRFTPAVSTPAPGSKPSKTIKAVPKKTRRNTPKN